MATFIAFVNFVTRFFVLTNKDRVESMEPPTEVPPPHRLQQRQQSNSFLNLAPSNLADQVPPPHRMDKLSWAALLYCITAGLEFNAIHEQVGSLSNRVMLLSLLLNIALCLLIAGNRIYAKTHPKTAFVMDRAGSVIVLLSSIIAAMPTVPL